MDSKPITSISAGKLLRPFLLESEELASRLKGIYPCVAPKGATFPYIEYHCAGLDVLEVKTPSPTDRVIYELNIYAVDYDEAVELAEKVRDILCNYRPAPTALPLSYHGASVTSHDEGWAGDCYCERLSVLIRLSRINN